MNTLEARRTCSRKTSTSAHLTTNVIRLKYLVNIREQLNFGGISRIDASVELARDQTQQALKPTASLDLQIAIDQCNG